MESKITITLDGAELVIRSEDMDCHALETSTVLRGRGISMMEEAFDDAKKAYNLALYFTQDSDSYRALVTLEQLQNFLLSNYEFYLEKSKAAVGLDSFIAFARNDIFCSYARLTMPDPKFLQPKLRTKRYVNPTDEELAGMFEAADKSLFVVPL